MTNVNAWIGYLEAKSKAKDLAALAALRSGLGKKPGEALGVLRHVAQFLDDKESKQSLRATFLISSLFGLHHESDPGSENLGAKLRLAVTRNAIAEESAWVRLGLVMTCEPEELDGHLRQAISILESKNIPLNWRLLFFDVKDLLGDDEERIIRVRTNWARSFWKTAPEQDSNPQDIDPENHEN